MEGELKRLRESATAYPFTTSLDAPIATLSQAIGKKTDFYLVDLPRTSDTLLDLKERVVDPIRRFMAGNQRQIYDEARSTLEAQEANLAHITGDEAGALRAILDDPACCAGNRMTQAKTLLDALRAKVAARVAEERAAARATLDQWWARIAGTPEYATLTPAEQAELRTPFDVTLRQIERQTLVAVIKDIVRRFDDHGHVEAMENLTRWPAARAVAALAQTETAARRTTRAPGAADAAAPAVVTIARPAPPARVIEPAADYVAQGTLPVAYTKPWLADENDVDAYLSALRLALLAAIKAGKRVRI